MTKEELLQLIDKYKTLSLSYSGRDDEQSETFERFAEFLEEYPEHSGLNDFDNEFTLWDYFRESEAEIDNYWETAFPEEDDDDSITDFLTKQ